MSTQMVEGAVLAPEPSLSAGICGLLQALGRGAKPDDSLRVWRGGGSILGVAAGMNLPLRDFSPVWIPEVILRRLEETAAVPWRVSLAVVHGRLGLDAESLSALAVSFTVARVFRNPRKPESTSGREWVFPEDQFAEILARLEGFSAPPTMVISALPDLVALWALDGAVPVAHPAAQDSAMSLLRALSARLKGDVPAEDARLEDLSMPLPGTAPANAGGYWEPASLAAFHPSRIYSLTQIEAAIAAKGK